ncbi:MAG: LCP family protein [Oscillospiraceae bacterium]|nr:LCP family protein [Oscillospiraceae bacterium]
MRRHKNAKGIAVLLIILVLVIVFIYSGLRLLESTVFYADETETAATKTITRNGVDYFPRQDIDVFLMMGIDRYGPVVSSGSYNNDGESDTVLLVVFDQKDETTHVINLNRDTMVQMPVLGIGGRQAGTTYGQLALAHTYGSGLEDSCENTIRTVSDLLYGITIDHYISMNMDAVATLNDAVGGVTVYVTDDFSGTDAQIPMGKTTLRGQQAVDYVRLRMDVGDQLNLSRMERQKDYIESFLQAFLAKLEENSTFTLETYDAVSDYIVTDCSGTVLSSVIERYADYTLAEPVSLKGENKLGERYMEFYADEAALEELVLDLFFVEK